MTDEQSNTEEKPKSSPSSMSKSRFDTFISERKESTSKEAIKKSKPLAELFPSATVMFGDLVGFTAWSSVREPHQVFTLLETIYASFDEIAVRRGVFKVETIVSERISAPLWLIVMPQLTLVSNACRNTG